MKGGGEMVDFPYTPKPTGVVRFLGQIQSMGVPTKVTLSFVESVGFKSKNDRPIVPILKALGFLDGSAVPTDRWRDYRDRSHAPRLLAEGIREAYSELFAVYPDAYRRDDEALMDFFKSKTAVAEKTVRLMVRTFRSLCELADFQLDEGKAAGRKEAEMQPTPSTTTRPPWHPINLSVNIELVLPATKDGSIYDALFESLKKHFPFPEA
jgi:hypothetical protein